MNIYQLYYKNKKKYKFWVQRESWGYTVAKIISIGNVIEGNSLDGKKPYYNNPVILAEFHKIDYSKGITVFDNISELSCAGTNQYHQIKSSDDLNEIMY